jgi:hypothetical protein
LILKSRLSFKEAMEIGKRIEKVKEMVRRKMETGEERPIVLVFSSEEIKKFYIEPKASPGNPPKDYGRQNKRAIGLFALRKKFCFEEKRVVVSRKGDIYIPLIPGLPDHESFHVSGEFHWKLETQGGKKIYPLCGATDDPMAFRFKFIMDRHPCFCFRCGEQLTLREIEEGLRFLCPYLPFNLEKEDVSEITNTLSEKGFYRFLSVVPGLIYLGHRVFPVSKWNDFEGIKRLLEKTRFEKDILRLRANGRIEKV